MSEIDRDLLIKQWTKRLARREFCDWMLLIELSEKNSIQPLEQLASAIADELRKEKPSPQFCQMLAEMIDPEQRGNISEYRLALRRKDRSRPKGTNRWLAIEMERLVDHVYGGDLKAIDKAVADVQTKFGRKGHCKRTCEAALKEGRRMTKVDNVLDEVFTAE